MRLVVAAVLAVDTAAHNVSEVFSMLIFKQMGKR